MIAHIVRRPNSQAPPLVYEYFLDETIVVVALAAAAVVAAAVVAAVVAADVDRILV